VVAGLAGISKGYLSRLETGQRQFERRGLLDDPAAALECSVVDLTGQPYLPPDRAIADALATLPDIRLMAAPCMTCPTCRLDRCTSWWGWPGRRTFSPWQPHRCLP
jgi:transcriptional regulator with XRE-family HTH domain